MCIAIAARGDGHMEILAELAQVLMDPDKARELREADDPDRIIALLAPRGEEEQTTDHRRQDGTHRMKVARFYAPGDIRLEDAPEPEPGPGELKIRVRNCSTCGTDVKISRFGHHHIAPPRVMGHEIAGEVAETGEGVTGWAAGDRVQVIAAIPVGACPECRRGRMTVCHERRSRWATTTTAGSPST